MSTTRGGVTEHPTGVQTHALPVRIAHWGMAAAILVMIGSGWRIYNAEPIFPFTFPDWATLSGDVDQSLAIHGDPGVATAIAWHFSGMWLLVASVLLFVGYGVVSGHFRRDFLPVGPVSFLRDFIAAARFRLEHRLGAYNAVQKAFYWGVLVMLVVVIVSGIALWKPVQTYPLEAALGGFQGARVVHFLAMAAITLFLVVHLALVALVPSTLIAMITGRYGHAAPAAEPIPPAGAPR
ncbi:cytochrome b/b6 domain-containing protein [uncultured Methylobacterium sp.]|uniref:cytochrome b/b6 domain-containing protein n=1 Tax=uncultured Methylobacterium sp. TaxID=157278 RepID=UPI0035CA8B7B